MPGRDAAISGEQPQLRDSLPQRLAAALIRTLRQPTF
jgi:hypothetical protein